ncbi:MAG: ribosome biogenesis GTPase YlqF [Clostridiales bacterium]|nr:ribosome biogenesis GTPase YlqF [Clostridiales bacterium]
MQTINWYPGHMKKTRELIQKNLKLVDAVIEVVDARIPLSSRNPIIDELIGNKIRIIALNKIDLADEEATNDWISYFEESGYHVASVNSNSGEGVPQLFKLLEKIEQDKNKTSSRYRSLRLMIVGVPNVGKSSLINRMIGRKSAKTGDRPGVTRGKQWLVLENNMYLLDTPGILWPKFDDQKTGLYLAFCGSIKDEIMDIPNLALELIKVLSSGIYQNMLLARYKLEQLGDSPLETMELIAKKRGFILSGNRIDYERTGRTILDEFRAGTIGRITLERL